MPGASESATGINVGFLAVGQENSGFVGGYLVTNSWGRPLEFRLTSAVQPNKVQQILYGTTLPHFLCGELIGKTLIEKTATPVQMVVTDNPLALDLRRKIDIPVVLWQETPADPPTGVPVNDRLFCHAQFPDDVATIQTFLQRLSTLDLGEPFLRIREAMTEARKLGMTQRPAA